MSQDSQQAITHVLQQDSKILDNLLLKLKQLQQQQAVLVSLLDPKLANHCYVANIEHNCLVVITHNALWATKFRFQIPELLIKLREHPLFFDIQMIHCKIIPHSKAAASPSFAPAARLSVTTAQMVIAAAKTIQHKKLKDIMEKIALNTKDKLS